MKIVIMADKSAGNESIGEMWTETHIVDDSTTLKEVVDLLSEKTRSGRVIEYNGIERSFLKNVRIQIGREFANKKNDNEDEINYIS